MAHRVSNDILIPEIAKLVSGGQQVLFTPTGVSMRPFIEGGVDSVVLSRVDSPVRVGDILLCKYGQIFVLHRVKALTETGVILMGDGNLRGEEAIEKDNILARVIEIRSPKGRRKPMTRGYLWQRLLPIRWLLLKVYRKIILRLIQRY